jgi:hypothetical protein
MIMTIYHNFKGITLTLSKTTCTLALSIVVSTPVAVAATPAVSLTDSSIYGFGSTVFIPRAPITLPNGKVIYKDLTIGLKSDATGKLTFSPAAPTQSVSAPIPTSNLVAGTYSGAEGSFVLKGPLVDPAGGVSKWTISPVGGKPFCINTAIVYTGSETSSPLYARLKAVNITSKEYSYGIIGSDSTCSYQFFHGGLIGISQLGNQLQVDSFSYAGKDQHNPYTSVLFTLR